LKGRQAPLYVSTLKDKMTHCHKIPADFQENQSKDKTICVSFL